MVNLIIEDSFLGVVKLFGFSNQCPIVFFMLFLN